MGAAFSKRWREFRRGRPGHRFQERFERQQKNRSAQSAWLRWLKPVGGVVLVVAGVVLCFIPGPGVPLLLIGGSLLAGVSRHVARTLDWLELRARRVLGWGRRWWKHAPTPLRYLIAGLGVVLASGALYGGCQIVFGDLH